MELDLKRAAERLGTTRPKLMQLMREKGLLGADNLPAHPTRDAHYLRVKETPWQHAELGQQYSYTTRLKSGGLVWLARQLGIERPAPPPTPDPREVA